MNECELIIEKADANGNVSFETIEKFEFVSFEDAERRVNEYVSSHPGVKCKYKYDNKPSLHGMKIWHYGIETDGTDDAIEFFQERIGKYRLKINKIRKLMKNKHYCNYKKVLDAYRVIFLSRVKFWRKLNQNKLVCSTIRFLTPIWDWIDLRVVYPIKNKFHNICHWFRKMKYFIQTGHDIEEYWYLDTHILKDIKWNLNRLIEESHGINNAFMLEVIDELNKDNPNYDKSKWIEYDNEETRKNAVKRQNEMYRHIIHLIDLYWFYSDNGDDLYGEKTDDMKLIFKPNSCNNVDYAKMGEKAREYWNEIWDLTRKYGEGWWD